MQVSRLGAGLIVVAFASACSSAADAPAGNATTTPGGHGGSGGASGTGGSASGGGAGTGGSTSGGGAGQAGAGSASGIVGPAGGHLETANGVRVDIPAGALEQKVTITISPAASVPASSGQLPVGPAVHFGPADTHFLKPIVLTLPLDPSQLPAGRSAAEAQVVVRADGAAASELLCALAIDAEHVMVRVQHFSDYVVVGPPAAVPPAGAAPAGATACNLVHPKRLGLAPAPNDRPLSECFDVTMTLACPPSWHATWRGWEQDDFGGPQNWHPLIRCEVDTRPTYSTVELGCAAGFHPTAASGLAILDPLTCEVDVGKAAWVGPSCPSSESEFIACQLGCPSEFERVGPGADFTDSDGQGHAIGFGCAFPMLPGVTISSHCRSKRPCCMLDTDCPPSHVCLAKQCTPKPECGQVPPLGYCTNGVPPVEGTPCCPVGEAGSCVVVGVSAFNCTCTESGAHCVAVDLSDGGV